MFERCNSDLNDRLSLFRGGFMNYITQISSEETEGAFFAEVKVNTNELKIEMEVMLKRLIKLYMIVNINSTSLPLRDFLQNFERNLIDMALKVCNENQRQAAGILGLKPTCLNEKIKRFNRKKSTAHN
jgi:DNA-binding NtrC family response regulator